MAASTKKRAVIAVVVLVSAIIVVVALAPGGSEQPADTPVDGRSSASAHTESTSATPSTSEPIVAIPTYQLSPSSKVALTGRGAGGKYRAIFGAVTGTFKLNGNQIPGSAFEISLDTTSLSAEPASLSEALQSADFLEGARYRHTQFVSTAIEESDAGATTHVITGNLTLHGVLKSMRVPASIELGDDSIRIHTEIALRRSDFGIERAGKPDDPFDDAALLELDVKLDKVPPQD